MTSFLPVFLISVLLSSACSLKTTPSQPGNAIRQETSREVSAVSRGLQTGAARLDEYLPLLAGKKVALVVNQTSLVSNGERSVHLVDTLLSRQVSIKKIFAPEHGFRGTADAGEKVSSGLDSKTRLPLVSLYGKDKKPSREHLDDVDVVIFDIQDVGARFYTYISTMHYVMEACAGQGKSVLVLDRPNPNGHYIDGPVLDLKFQSFVGMHPIPLVHGLTVGELAQMINGEGWLAGGAKCSLQVISCQNYTHKDAYSLPVRPSPNLPNDRSVALYPSLCLFEGTVVSVGRGTDSPFQVIGHPDYPVKAFSFTPKSVEGAKNPPYLDKVCYGTDLRREHHWKQDFSLQELMNYYSALKDKGTYFNDFFTRLAGTDQLRKQIESGMSEEQIRATWQPELHKYGQMRKKYLLYPDFDPK